MGVQGTVGGAGVQSSSGGGSGGPGTRVGLAANRPTATGSGLTYRPTDVPVVYVDDPATATWKQFFRDLYTPTPAPAGSYTLVNNTSGISLANLADVLQMQMMTVGTAQKSEVALLAGSLPSNGPWIVNGIFVQSGLLVNWQATGIVVCSGTTAGVSQGWDLYMYCGSNGANSGYSVDNIVLDGGTTGANPHTVTNSTIPDAIRVRFLSDGVNLHPQVAYQDTNHWFDVSICIPVPANLDHYGLFMGISVVGATSLGASALCYRNDLTTLTVPQATVTNVSAANPGVVTTQNPHGLQSGDVVSIHGVVGTAGFAALINTGTAISLGVATSYGWVIKVLSPTTFQCQGSNTSTSGVYSSGGTVTLLSR